MAVGSLLTDGNPLQNAQFFLDGMPVSSSPVMQARVQAAGVSGASGAGALFIANVVASKIQQLLTVVGTPASGISSVSNAATLYAMANAGPPPSAAISNLASGASVPTATARASV